MNAAGATGAEELRTSVVRSERELEPLAAIWDAVPVSYIDAELDYFLALVRNRPGVERPHVVLVERAGTPVGLCVGRIERTRVASRFGYKAVSRPELRMLRVSHGGVAGAEDERVAAAIVLSLEAALAAREADVYLVPAVTVGSALDEALVSLPSARRHAATPSLHHRLVLPATYDAFLASRDRKSRYNIRRQQTQLEEQLAGRHTLEVFDAGTPLDRVFADLGAVAEKTYQRGLGVGFDDTPERRAIAKLTLQRSAFRAWVLSVDGAPVAFWQGTARGRTFTLNTAGYDPAFATLGVGAYVQQRMFSDLCADGSIDIVDFGWGDADYKARFGSERWEEHDVMVFAPTFRGMRASLVRKAVAAADRGARRAATRVGVVGSVKRLWRRRLSGRGAR